MSPDRWRDLERIFAAARGLPAVARTEVLDRECASDPALREEALSLLSADEASGAFMVEPALERLARDLAAEGWSLEAGQRLGAYLIVQFLGAGGSGEVWRARDERLNRDVAVKILLPHTAADPARLRRFEDEMRAVGALNHPNVVTVHDVGEHHGIPFLVTEYLDGRDLRASLENGPLPAEKAVAIALDIAHGLAAAHARGIVHRDLKPENIHLKPGGEAKILDFGLAKLRSAEDAGLQEGHTMSGTIVGTAAYMAPEQVRSEPADARTDLFALGTILFEMLTGRNPFRRANTFETLQAITSGELPELPADGEVPPALARIVARLTAKRPEDRFQSAVDLAWALESLEEIAGHGPGAQAPAPARPRFRWRWPAATALASTAVLAAALLLVPAAREDRAPLHVLRFSWVLPAGMSLASPPMVSPDSRHIAFAATTATGTRLFVRSLDALAMQAVPASDGARQPFWAPDGRALGFFAEGQLKTVSWPGGAPVPVTEVLEPRGGAWSSSGEILFAPDVVMAGLHRVGTDAGGLAPATRLDLPKGDTSHWWPAFLPDGRHFLYFLRSTDDERIGVYVGRSGGAAVAAEAPLLRLPSDPVFAPLPEGDGGVLFYVSDGRIEVRRFDPGRLTVSPEARALGFATAEGTLYHPTMLSASADVLAYVDSALPTGNRMECVARDGTPVRAWNEPETQNWPRLSPDGRRLARQRVHELRNSPDIWIEDLERGTQVRVTTAAEPDLIPVWSPDGQYIAYVSGNLPGRPGGARTLRIASADGTGVVGSFPCPGAYCEPTDWSDDGHRLVVNVIDDRGSDVWSVALEDEGRAAPLLAESYIERDARLSPDGRWLAYVTEESGLPEVAVQAIEGRPRRIAVSSGGGQQPVWRRDGREMFFLDPEGYVHSVSVAWSDEGDPTFGMPVRLGIPPIGSGHWGTQYDVSPDGSRFYLIRRNDDPAPREIHLLVGWSALLSLE